MGVPARLQRPLDFLVVADHSDGLGVAPLIARSDPLVLESAFGRTLHDLVKEDTEESIAEAYTRKNAGNIPLGTFLVGKIG